MSPRRGKKCRFQVEALEGRIALSSAVPIPGPEVVGPAPTVVAPDGSDALAASVTTEQLHLIMPHLPQADLGRYIGPLNRMLKEFHIDTPKREAAFLAQVAVESAELREWNEIGNPSQWRGRGPIQLTGFDAYKHAAQDLRYDIVNHPELVADTSHPTIGFRTSGWFWSNYKAYAHLNATADSVKPSDPASVEHVNQVITRVVNGGTNGLSARLRYYKLALQVLHA